MTVCVDTEYSLQCSVDDDLERQAVGRCSILEKKYYLKGLSSTIWTGIEVVVFEPAMTILNRKIYYGKQKHLNRAGFCASLTVMLFSGAWGG
jgi:hypothetical protein